MSPGKIVNELQAFGFVVKLEGDKIKLSYPVGSPPEKAMPLLEEIRNRKHEVIAYLKQKNQQKVIDFQEEAQKRGYSYPFPYPLNETLGIGEWDPLDIKYVNGKPVLQPGWWRKVPRSKK